MKQALMDLDHKGLLPLLSENEGDFYERGQEILDIVRDFKPPKGSFAFNREDPQFEKRFLTNPSWVPSYFSSSSSEYAGFCHTVEQEGVKIPAIEILLNSEIVFRHELIHAVRRPIEEDYSTAPGFYFGIGTMGKTAEAFTKALEDKIFPESYFLHGDYPDPSKALRNLALLSAAGFIASTGFFVLGLMNGETDWREYAAGIISVFSLTSLPWMLAPAPVKNRLDTLRVYNCLKKIRLAGEAKSQGVDNPELGYTLLRMTNREVLDFSRHYSKKENYPLNFRDYVGDNASGNLRFQIMAERLG